MQIEFKFCQIKESQILMQCFGALMVYHIYVYEGLANLYFNHYSNSYIKGLPDLDKHKVTLLFSLNYIFLLDHFLLL